MEYQPQIKYLDKIEEMYGNELLIDILGIFQKQVADALILWKRHASSQGLADLKESAHKLKSSARSVGAFALADVLQKIENRTSTEGLSKDFLNIEKLYMESLTAINEWIQKSQLRRDGS